MSHRTKAVKRIFFKCLAGTAVALSAAALLNLFFIKSDIGIDALVKSAVIFFVIIFVSECIRAKFEK